MTAEVLQLDERRRKRREAKERETPCPERFNPEQLAELLDWGMRNGYALEERTVRDLIEAARNVRLEDPRLHPTPPVPHERLANLLDRVVTRTTGTKSIGTWKKVRLEYRLDYQLRRRLDYAVFDDRNT